MYSLEFTKNVDKEYKKIIKKNPKLIKRITKSLLQLQTNPLHPGLKSHQIDHKKFGKIFSSWVIADLRILWKYDENEQLLILLLKIGNHAEVY